MRFVGLVFAGARDVVDLCVRDGQVSCISPSAGPPRWFCIPPLADLHVHANRAFTPPSSRPRGLEDAVGNVAGLFASFDATDYRDHAMMLIDAARRHGTTRLRTHADVDPAVGLQAVAGSLDARGRCREDVDVEVVAFAAAGADPATAEGRAMLRDAVAMGADFIGAAPAFCAEQMATIDAVLDLAAELSVPVDMHLDEHLDPDRCASGYVAEATMARAMEGRVTIGHACAVAMLPSTARSRLIEALAEARITVIALPRTNLYLQDAATSLPIRRGVAPVREMSLAGVPVRFASDNVRDAFFPYGDADLVGVARDGILASHLDESQQVVAAICDGRVVLEEGDCADMVLLRGTDFDALIADPPARRWVVRRGQPQLVGGAPG